MTQPIRLVVTGAVCVTVCAAMLAGQTAAPAARAGTGVVIGQVVDAIDGRPVPGVTVTMVAGSSLPGEAAGALAPPKRTVTDGQGRFVFHSLPAGRVSIDAQASGYVPAGADQHRPGGPSAPIALADGERLGSVRVRIWKHAAIEGTVIDDRGDPLVRYPVRALKREWAGGAFRLTPTAAATTDDRGAFRLWGLVPGDYVVTVVSTQTAVPVSVTNTYIDQLGQQPTGEFQRSSLSMRLSSSNAPTGGTGGQVIGSHLLQSTRGVTNATLPAPGSRMAVYLATYTPALNDRALHLESGEERQGIELVVPLVPASTVSGVAVGPDGPVPYLGLRLTPAAFGEGPTSQGLDAAATVTDAQGAFTFLGVPAGEYVLSGLYIPRGGAGGVSAVVATGGGMNASSFAPVDDPDTAPPEPTAFAHQPVSVGERDLTGLVVRIRHGLRISGSIAFEGASPPPAKELFQRFTVTLRPVAGFLTGMASPTRVDTEGRFESVGYPAGRYFLNATSSLPAWTMASVTLAGRDISRAAIELGDADLSNLVITFSDQHTLIRGSARTNAGAPDADAVVLMFPADTRTWIAGGMNSRLRGVARTTSAGTFVIGGLPPGDYRAMALSEDLALESQDPAFIESLARLGTAVTLAPGEQRVLDLRTEAPRRREAEGSGPFVPEDGDEQGQAAPPRDGLLPMATGTGVISGTVVTDEATPKPLRRVMVQLLSPVLRPAVTTTTDDAGRFLFRDLPEGRYALMATKLPYVDASYGATRPGRTGPSLEVANGERVTGLVIRMMRGAVIEGTVRNEHARPVENAQVTLLRRQADRSLQIASVGAIPLTQTDDRGRFRFFGLPPGEYTVGISPRNVLDLAQTTAAAVRWATDAVTAGRGPLAPVPSAPALGSAPVYYPGVTDASGAGMVAVTAGEERTGVDLTTALVPTARVQGRLVNADGQPPRSVQVNIVPDGLVVPTMNLPMFVRPMPDGSFSVAGVNPGRYVLVARGASTAGGRGTAPVIDLWAKHEFEVHGQDIVGMTVMLAPGLQLSGRVLFDAATPPAPEQRPRVSVRLDPPSRTSVSIETTPGLVKADATFSIAGLAPAGYRVVASTATRPGVPASWVMKSAVAGGVDVTDSLLTLTTEGGTPELVVTMTDRVSEVTGLLTDAAGRPALDYSILVFPVDKNQWAQGARRRPPAARPATDGRYRVQTLPPGEYYVVALTEIDPTEMYDSKFLESLIPSAQKFTLAEGEKKTLDFKIAGGG